MGKKDLYMEKAVFVIKCMLGAYILTAGLLLLLAFMLYRFGLSEKVVSICIIAVYIIVTFLAGLLAGKKEKRRKFLWGLIMGALYFGILVVVSLAVNKGVEDIAGNMMPFFFLCAGSAMLGGMVTKSDWTGGKFYAILSKVMSKSIHKEDTPMKHIKTLSTRDLKESMKKGGCGECQTSCQSACKTSCTVGNQSCEKAR